MKLSANFSDHAVLLMTSAARSYPDVLTDSYVMRQLPPIVTNLKKRAVKAPQVDKPHAESRPPGWAGGSNLRSAG